MQIQLLLQQKTMTQNQKKSKVEESALRELSLPSNSNEVKLDYSVPITEVNFDNTRLGAKSTEKKQANDQELLEYRRRLYRSEATLTPDEIRSLVYETNQRRTALEESIRQQKEEYMQRHNLEIQTKRIKEREDAHQLRIKNENETQREQRLAAEEEVKTTRAKEFQSLQNRSRKEKEEVMLFFEQSSNRFNSKYGTAIKKISGETGIDRIISSRPFSTNRYAHRCVPCGYHQPESLSISKIYQHIYENKDSHMQFVLSEIDNTYNNLIIETRRKHAAEDNPDLRHQKLSKDIESLTKLRGAKYR
jgi:hypothetical protein